MLNKFSPYLYALIILQMSSSHFLNLLWFKLLICIASIIIQSRVLFKCLKCAFINFIELASLTIPAILERKFNLMCVCRWRLVVGLATFRPTQGLKMRCYVTVSAVT
ncbi:hypothetical protein LOK49_LG08G00465 [Camellia lanceoleosa]|uniref:Uncharacterized protein n=1 Tax=Camellia lanceoleosa TaxID=1840588 RepID=A0ACC0GXH2_9ERIC|nr:hypothetical protein LOK49_LG08G00465 [Camellia lanceoleosa]